MPWFGSLSLCLCLRLCLCVSLSLPLLRVSLVFLFPFVLLSALRGVLGDRSREKPLVRCGQRRGRRGEKKKNRKITLPNVCTKVTTTAVASHGGNFRGRNRVVTVTAQQTSRPIERLADVTRLPLRRREELSRIAGYWRLAPFQV